MRYLTRLLVFIPLSLHVAYAAATVSHLPTHLGQTPDSPGLPLCYSLAAWIALVVISNLSFIFLHIRMPKFKNATLSLPGVRVDLTDKTVREEYVAGLRAVAETSLLSLNVFFLAAYQAAYQANTAHPVLQFPRPVLFVGFMALPLLIAVLHTAMTVQRFRNLQHPPEDS